MNLKENGGYLTGMCGHTVVRRYPAPCGQNILNLGWKDVDLQNSN